MTDDLASRPRRPGRADPAHELTPETAAVPAPAAPVTPAPAVPAATTAAESYSPTPEARPDWIRTYDAPPATPTPERWYEPAAEPAPAVAVAPATSRRTGGPVVAVGAAVGGPRLRRHGPRARRDRRPRPHAARRDHRGRGHHGRRGQAGHHRRELGDHRGRGARSARRSSGSRSPATRTTATWGSSPRPASAPASSTTATAGSSPTATSSRAATSSTSSSRTAASSPAPSTASTR